MCGIFGFSYSQKMKPALIKEIIHDLFILSNSRGKEASGIAYVDNNEIFVQTTGSSAKQFVNSKDFQNKRDTFVKDYTLKFILGHTRLATNGTQYDKHNNQPVVTTEGLVIHNGMVLNEAAILNKFKTIRKNYEVDSEIILKLTDYFVQRKYSLQDAVIEAYKELVGAASVGILHCNFNEIVAATNTGSLYYTHKKNELFIFASERYYLENIIAKNNFTSEINQVIAGSGISYNLSSYNLSTFQLNRKGKPIHQKNTNKLFSIHTTTVPSFNHITETVSNKLSILKKHSPAYDKIKKITRCTKCILPQTMPLIRFNNEGVCNYCLASNPIRYKGFNKLQTYIKKYRSRSGKADCIVALSGGRDSSYGLHYAKNVLKLNPIAYTYDWGMVTDIARRNQYRLTAALGVEHIIVSADISKKRDNIRKNIEAWLRKPNIAMIPLFMAGDKQAEYYAEQIIKQTGIKLAIYCRGNELEDERFKFGYYGIFNGTPGGVLHNLSWMGKVQLASYYAREYLQNPSYINTSIFDTVFAYFSAYMMNHSDFIYLWHYIPWNEDEIVTTLKNEYGWESPQDTIATWRIDDGTPPFYNYIYYQVQGFTEHDGLRSNQIRQGIITREKALKLVEEENKPRYEALQWYFDATKINGDKALSIIDNMNTIY